MFRWQWQLTSIAWHGYAIAPGDIVMSPTGDLIIVDYNANSVLRLTTSLRWGWQRSAQSLKQTVTCYPKPGNPLVLHAVAFDAIRDLYWIYALHPAREADWDGEGAAAEKEACIIPLEPGGTHRSGQGRGVTSEPVFAPIDLAVHWNPVGGGPTLELASGWGPVGLQVGFRGIGAPWSRMDSLQRSTLDILVPDRTRQSLLQWSFTEKTGELDLTPHTPLAPAVTGPDEALLLLRAAPGGSGRARMARIGIEGTRMWVKEAWDAAEPSPPEGEWPWALAASPAGYAFSTTDGKRFMIARYDAAGRRLPPLYGGRYRSQLSFRQSERIDRRRISVDGATVPGAVLADAAGGEWQRLNPADPRGPLPWAGEMLVDVATAEEGADTALYRLVRDPDRLERWAPDGSVPIWTVELPLSDEARVAAADWGAVVGLPGERRLRFFAAPDGAALGEAQLPAGAALADVAALPRGEATDGEGAALSLDAAGGLLQRWAMDGRPGPAWRVAESGSALRVSARRIQEVASPAAPAERAAILTSDGFVELHDLADGYLGRFQPVAPSGVLTQTTDLALLADGGLLLAEAAGSAVHHFAPASAPTSTASPSPAASATSSASPRPSPSPRFTGSPTPTPRPTSLNPSRTPTRTPTPTPSLTPTPIPTCVVSGDKVAAPARLVLGQSAAVTLTLSAACVGRPRLGGADVVVALDRSGSMAEDSFRRARRDVGLLAAALDGLGYRLGLASFAADARPEFRLGAPARQPLSAIDSLTADGSTRIDLGLEEAALLLADARPDALKVIVLLTDGRHSLASAPPEPVAARLAAEGVLLLALAYGPEPDIARLRALTGGEDLVWPASAGLDLAGIAERIRGFAEDSLAGQLSVDDLLGSEMALVEGSVAPAAIQGPGRLLWSRPLMPRRGMTLIYRVRPLATGRLPVNRSAQARYTDADGSPGSYTFPVPYVEVIAPSPTPTASPTATARPAALFLPLLLAEPPCRSAARPLDAVLVLDASASMTGAKLVAAQAAARAFATALDPGKDHMAIVSFNQEARVLATLAAGPAAVEAAIAAIQPAPGTRMDRGIALALAELLAQARPAASSALILLTDGRQDQDPDAALRAAAAARAAGIQLHAVGFGQDADIPFLARLAPDPGALHRADDAAALLALYRQLAEALPCQGSRGWSGR